MVAVGVLVALVVLILLYRYLRKLFYGALLLAILVGAVAFVYRVQLVQQLRPLVHKAKRHSPANLCAVTIKNLKLKKNDYYRLHIPSAKKRGEMKVVASIPERDELIEAEVLVPLKGMKGYSLRKMIYGSPHVHSDTKIMLEELQQRFAAALKESGVGSTKIVISSAYRTTDQHNRLRETLKPGKASRGVSSHSYGASVDIPWLQGRSCAKAKPHFQKVLSEMQKEGRLYICPESDTIHVTVR